MVGVQPKAGALGPNGIAFLDLLRAIAANLVLFGHANDIFGMKSGIPAGLIGVSVFFLLSGFLITQSSLSRIRYQPVEKLRFQPHGSGLTLMTNAAD